MLRSYITKANLVALACSIALSAAAAEDAAPTYIDVPAGDLVSALELLEKQSQAELVYYADQLKGVRTRGVSGKLTAQQAVEKLLEGTEVRVQMDEATGAMLIAAPAAMTPATAAAIETTSYTESAPSERYRLAQNSSSAGSSENESAKTSASSFGDFPGQLEEIIVTAQKREERLIDVPQSVSVISADDLTRLGATQFRDFANTIPGLTFTTTGAGFTQIALRGVTTGFLDVGQTVGIYIDDVPYGSSSAFADGPRVTLDAGLFDLDKIEVLRGPQGTLYGASAMGGLLKYGTRVPELSRLGVDVRTGLAGTEDGGLSYNGSVTLNAPIVEETAAVRASGFYSHDGGYIDNVSLDDDDVNQSKTYGGRADLLLKPSDALSIRIAGFAQNIEREGEGTADYAFSGAPLFGRLDQGRLTAEPFDQRFRLASATVAYDFDGAALTSISGYQTAATDLIQDLSRGYVPLLQSFGLSYNSVGVANVVSTDKYTQEIRLTSSGERTVDWMFGGFYTHEKSEFSQNFVLRDPAGQPAPNILLSVFVPSRYEEYAGFGNLTWHINERIAVTGGARYAQNDQLVEQIGSGLLIGSRPSSRAKQDVVTYLANARYRFNERATAYVRYATGYRPGGPNYAVLDPATGLPVGAASFDSDSLKSYEAGFKAQTADGRFAADAAAYLIEWDNIQISVIRGGLGAIANSIGSSRVPGAELTLVANLIPGLALSGAFSYTDAHMADADPALGAARGERMPNVARFSGAFNVDYQLPLRNLAPTIGATLRHMGERNASFDNSVGTAGVAPQYTIPSYTTLDLRAGFTFDRFDLQLYVRNALDERGELSAFTWRGSPATAILQPRTVGINAVAHF